MLVLPPFEKKQRRVTPETAQMRNLFVAALASRVLVADAAPGSKTEAFVRQIQMWELPLWTVASHENEHLLRAGVRALKPDGVSLWQTNSSRP